MMYKIIDAIWPAVTIGVCIIIGFTIQIRREGKAREDHHYYYPMRGRDEQ